MNMEISTSLAPSSQPQASPISYTSASHMLKDRDNMLEGGQTADVADYQFFHSKKFKICFLAMWCV